MGRGCDCRSGGHAFCAPRVAEGASALRILECARLRIKDVDFHQRILTLQETSRGDWREPRQTARSAARRANLAMGREGVNGGNGRVTMLPDAAREALREQMKLARTFYDADRVAGKPGVHLSSAMAYKAASLATSWPWFWLFDSFAPLTRPSG
jgi:integrase